MSSLTRTASARPRRGEAHRRRRPHRAGIRKRPRLLAAAAHVKRWASSATAQQEMQMIIVFTTFKLPKPITREEARGIFLSTAPRYRGVQGLLRKHYVLSQDGATAGGIYLWTSRPEAEAMYTESWRSL